VDRAFAAIIFDGRVVTDTAGMHAAAWQNLFDQPERGKQVEAITPSSSASE
jgi:hypothetical protein